MSTVVEKRDEAVSGPWERHGVVLLKGSTTANEKVTEISFKGIEYGAALDNASLEVDSMFGLVVLFSIKTNNRPDGIKSELWGTRQNSMALFRRGG